ncbi:undecaprenyl-diphosphatase UppP [Rubrobacter radiotolerans]|uniref:Undecaprenyl-diphosphatase n=1 Tax=Rubrobacter radiotolerans TaxID=42256 RepID=A0AB35T5N2_RUBRA|nr:undecaprenyl-diphosphatase UppP [Rubrobacter radiotolerans]MDX5893912.1 undecaprenyl-diphosphatase UppP [Rubrobacter radiotolerans]SMC04754.1 Undecaprenyl-diphosphatase [Rubrobacter radiotolerans DSM 5868]
MREFIEAFFLGIVQGLTEFLPVSSSGHLLLGQYFLGLDQEKFGLAFDVALHLGTLTAVVVFFWNDLFRMAYAFLRSLTRRRNLTADGDQRLAYLVIASVFPAAIIGFFFEDIISTVLRNPWIVVVNLVLVGVLFIVAERVGRRTDRITKLTFPQAVFIGVAQAAALVPGVSRSGATITLGLFLNLRREEAARFSFLMSVPIIAGAGTMQLAEVISAGMSADQVGVFLLGFLSSGVVGYLTIRFFIRFVADHSLRAFAYYRFALAAVVAVLLLTFFPPG